MSDFIEKCETIVLLSKYELFPVLEECYAGLRETYIRTLEHEIRYNLSNDFSNNPNITRTSELFFKLSKLEHYRVDKDTGSLKLIYEESAIDLSNLTTKFNEVYHSLTDSLSLGRKELRESALNKYTYLVKDISDYLTHLPN